MQETAEEPLNEEDLFAFIDSLSKELQQKGCVNKSDYRVLFWTIQKFLRFLSNPQPQHLDEVDILFMKQLRVQRFSLADIGFILDPVKIRCF